MSLLKEKLSSFPRVEFAHLPTKLEKAQRLSDALGIELWIKRDDCTGVSFGGNKARQLEFYLGEAQAQRADCLLITGAIQSNFVRIAAAFANKLGMEAHLQLEDRVQTDDSLYRQSGSVWIDHLMGATLYPYHEGEDESGADKALHQIADDLKAKGKKPYIIHLGADHPPLGALGYAVAAQELLNDFDQQSIQPDAIFVGSGSGATHSGLILGLRASQSQISVWGTCVRRNKDIQKARIVKQTHMVADILGIENPVHEEDVITTDISFAPGYGQMGDLTIEALQMAAELEGLILDPVYTAKVLGGLIGEVRSGQIAKGSKVVFIHTGGTPGVFAYQNKIEEFLANKK
jgi:D-cysteine desulfhydrase family pyridoxal phosphate-dependent enzyme